MFEPFYEAREHMMIPTIEVRKREDNGHYTASAMGQEVTHHDQAQAVQKLAAKLQEMVLSGDITPLT